MSSLSGAKVGSFEKGLETPGCRFRVAELSVALESLSVSEQPLSGAGHVDGCSPGFCVDVGLGSNLLEVRVLAEALGDLLGLLLFVGVVFGAGLVEGRRGRAVHLEPPVTDQVRLAEDGAVGTQERDFAGCVADMEYLECDKNT